MVLLSSDTLKIVCTDGMDPDDVKNLGKILNFGAQFRFEKCGPEMVYRVISKSARDMDDAYMKA